MMFILMFSHLTGVSLSTDDSQEKLAASLNDNQIKTEYMHRILITPPRFDLIAPATNFTKREFVLNYENITRRTRVQRDTFN